MNLQRCRHVAWRDAVDADLFRSPFDGETGDELTYGGLGHVVRPSPKFTLAHIIHRIEVSTHACGCGTLTMAPDMLPISTMLPGARRSMRWRATAVAKK